MNQPFEILIAEDNPADVGLVREALKMRDINCVLHVLRDGEQALTLLDSRKGIRKGPGLTCLFSTCTSLNMTARTS